MLNKAVAVIAFAIIPIVASSAEPKIGTMAPKITDAAEATIQASLTQELKTLESAMAEKNGPLILELVTQEQKDFAEEVGRAFNLKPQDGILTMFQGYTITGINRFIIGKGIAFLDVKVRYSRDAVSTFRKEEKQGLSAVLYSPRGGTSHTTKCQEAGIGRATFYMVLQRGKWKFHFIYFSFEPMSASDLETAAELMKPLVHK